MFFNKIKLTNEGIKDATQKIIDDLTKSETCAIARYGTAAALQRACEKAAAALKKEAEKEMCRDHSSSQGKQFEHEGVDYKYSVSKHYDFSGIRGWETRKKSLTNAESTVTTRRKQLKSFETEYLAVHKPFADTPKEIEVSISFCPK